MKRVVLLVLAALALPAHAEDTQPYVVQPGDSCLGIALRVLGERTAFRDIHRLNPQLGALPHDLVPGTLLTLPKRTVSTGPDATVTRTAGNVRVRKPSDAEWDPAVRGTDLFRSYRVGAASEASAELTFGDDGLLEMRERTIVVIYGPEKKAAAIIRATAELERGTLEARLGDLDGKKIVIATPAAEADVRTANVVVRAGDGGPSAISNHRGAAVAVRGRTKQKTTVRVAAGMGTRVVRGKAPEPPRPLPATPTWQTPAGPHLAGTTGSTQAAWAAVDRAAIYRVAVRDAAGELVVAASVDAPVTSLALPLVPGAYGVTIAAIDADGLESVPSSPLELVVLKPRFVAPSGVAPAAGAALPRKVVVGTTVISPDSTTCAIAGSTGLVFDRVVTAELTCALADGRRTPPVAIDVQEL